MEAVDPVAMMQLAHDELSPVHRELRRAVPEVYRGFRELRHAAEVADGPSA